MKFDDKQKRIINAWISYGTSSERDSYAQFISLWVAFNAICYARYSSLASRNRADLRHGADLKKITDELTQLNGTIVRMKGQVKINIKEPGRIVINIGERYTEDIIFDRFAVEFQPNYIEWLSDRSFETKVLEFREALRKPPDRYYVVNMARVSKHKWNAKKEEYEDMKRQNIIVPFEDHTNLKQLKNVLYQVRCNVFHGEKVPGEPNDDRIVSAAYPVLRYIVWKIAPKNTVKRDVV